MKSNEQILKKYFEGKVFIDNRFDIYEDLLNKALFVINTKLNNSDLECIAGLAIGYVHPDSTNGVFITETDTDVQKEHEVQTMSMFLRQSTGIESIAVSVNKEERKTIIFSPNYKSTDFWKALCGLLPMLAPWCLSFDGKNKDDVDRVKSYLAKSFESGRESEEAAEQIFLEIFNASDLRNEMLKEELEVFSQTFLRKERERLQNNIHTLKDRQQDLIRDYEIITSQIQESKISLMGIEANNGQHIEVVKDIMFTVDTTNDLNITDIDGDCMYFDYITPMEIWSGEEFEIFVENKSSYLYSTMRNAINDLDPSIAAMEKLLRGIFETREYKIRFLTMFQLDFSRNRLTNAAANGSASELNRYAKSLNCIFNPHIGSDMTCMEEYAMQVAQCINEGLYSDAIGSMCMAAKSFTISDTYIGARLIDRCMREKCIQTADGIKSGQDIIKELMAQEEKEMEG